MSYEKIHRVTVDHLNTTNGTELAEFRYQNKFKNIIDQPATYNVYPDTSQIDLYNMPLDLHPLYQICLFVNDKTLVNDATGLKYGPNFFAMADTEYSPMQTIFDFVDWLFYVTAKQTATPIINFDLDLETHIFNYTITPDEYKTYFTLNGKDLALQMYFNIDFQKIFPNFLNLKEPTTLANSSELWFPFNLSVAPTTTTTVSEKSSTISNILKAKRLEFESTMGTTPHQIFSKDLGSIIERSILSSILINAETTNIVTKTNIIYLPNINRDVTFDDNRPIRDFTISCYVVYADGTRTLLTLAPRDYFGLTLAFAEIKKNVEDVVE